MATSIPVSNDLLHQLPGRIPLQHLEPNPVAQSPATTPSPAVHVGPSADKAADGSV